jgi:RNA polymerase sigma-70 factor (ECF subfamily)
MRMETLALNTAVSLDKQALVGIYQQYSPDLFRFAYRLLGDNELAEDCVSETFSRFLRAVRDGGGPSENVRAYLYRIAQNWVTDHYRRQPLPPLALEAEEHTDPEGNPSQVVVQEIERQNVRAALLRLPPEQRQVIELRFLEDWSHEAVASAIGKSVEATRALQHRALAAMRRMLLEQEV